MLAVVFDLEPAVAETPECKRVLAKLTELGVPYLVLRDVEAPNEGVKQAIRHFRLPAHCIWYVTDKSEGHAKAVLKNGMHSIRVGHDCESISGVLEVLAEPYTRSALALHYLLGLHSGEI
jgi:hypothetical protein